MVGAPESEMVGARLEMGDGEREGDRRRRRRRRVEMKEEGEEKRVAIVA